MVSTSCGAVFVDFYEERGASHPDGGVYLYIRSLL
jgi:hypothetical protein